MKNKVLVSIRGTQHDIDDEGIQTIQPGLYRKLSNMHVISYEEVQAESVDGPPVTAHCLLKITPDSVTMSKKGDSQTQMFFKEGESCETIYHTPMGAMSLNLHTTRLLLQEEEDALHVELDYHLSMNGQNISQCTIAIQISEIHSR